MEFQKFYFRNSIINIPYASEFQKIQHTGISQKHICQKLQKYTAISQEISYQLSYNMDKIPGTSLENIGNNLTIQSKSNELMDVFNIKTREITKAMQGLHFSTNAMRNKLSRGHITNNCPIIMQVTMGNNATTQGKSGDLSPFPVLMA